MNVKLKKTSKKYRLADLFSGCGGMTLGFMQNSNFEPVFAVDNNKASIDTYRTNFDQTGTHSYCMNIEEVIEHNKIPEVDIVIGGPPCQGFSLLNKKRKNDKRRELWYYYLEFVKLSNAQVIVMENVPQLLSGNEFNHIINNLKMLGFRYIVAHTVNAANFGIPQTRQRAIIMASKNNYISLPRPSHLKPEKYNLLQNQTSDYQFTPWKTVRNVINDLPDPEGSEIRNIDSPLNLHFGRKPTLESIERYKAVPPGGNRFDLQKNRPDITPKCWLNKPSGSTDLFGRLWWDKPSVTIRTEFYKPEKGRYLHPEKNRPITHREAARIQTFPDTFKFNGSKIEIAKQIGNAVPPILAYKLAEEAIASLNNMIDEHYVHETISLYEKILNEKIYYIYHDKK